MNIALVTNKGYHHKYWVVKMESFFNVKVIIHPQKKDIINRLREKRLFRYGGVYFFFKLLSIFYSFIYNKSLKNQNRVNEKRDFSKYEKEYNQINKDKIYNLKTINSCIATNIIKENNIDVICFLGGEIAKNNFINSARVCALNFHSGLSPFYNGNKTNFFAVSDFRPNFCGGTLMNISQRIDGGTIISHYLMKIEKDDTASSLFMKNIKGSIILYLDYLNNLGLPIKSIKQNKSFKYFKNLDWTIIQDLRLRYFEKKGLMKNYVREEKVIRYYPEKSKNTLFTTMESLMK